MYYNSTRRNKKRRASLLTKAPKSVILIPDKGVIGAVRNEAVSTEARFLTSFQMMRLICSPEQVGLFLSLAKKRREQPCETTKKQRNKPLRMRA